MIASILIANRGEIAVRVVRACKDLGLRSVVAYSTADKDTLAVRMADQAVCIGGPATKESYLQSRNIIMAACLTRCDAIHPGVGFLSENAGFARQVEDAGLIFIGPKSETIALLGNKVEARKVALKAGLPITPGSKEAIIDLEDAKQTAQSIGYPIILKAAAGGGGRGMRIVRKEADLAANFAVAKKEALLFFGDDAVHMERYLEQPRHLEVQLLSDGQGTVLHLGERDCSVQKNHQKLLEESPSPVLSDSLRNAMCNDAVRLFQELGYRGAGTVEFLLDGDAYYFMEVNARLQVEHPVSELVSGIDLVHAQIDIAQGKTLSYSQADVRCKGYSLECRINGLSAGEIKNFVMPCGPHVRVDTYLQSGSVLSPYYDSLIAKIIVYTPTREMGLSVMLRALDEVVIEGVKTNIEEQKLLIKSRPFSSGRFSTDLYTKVITQEKSHG
ncbi:MAG: biotin carboxylase N-terminal domain-containing protein [Sphaerochaeta associata]|uniref:acetyl-CoA carboxylase biotin carboxylase subunit n=1 Tax=Sphaerochaeta associata TaxID=1129264 RepID=UPI002B1F4790|nr:biotin carboxylase N-terminal domain-containing protein [Sphaerochaeta associata]MEA5105863.1 biotin carboxylase N-terminal domain-containing protein [Sphaerochaeta associata]